MISQLRVGIPIPSVAPTDGGAYELESTIFVQALKRYYYGKHLDIKIVPITFDPEKVKLWNLDPTKCLILGPENEGKTYTHSSAINSSVHVLWSTNPCTLSTQLPFIITIWDLQHRLQPFFPEVSELGGWPWQARENHYTSIATKAFCCVVGTERGSNELTQFYGVDPSRILVNPFPCPQPLCNNADEGLGQISKYEVERQKYLLYPAQFWSHKNHLSALHALKILVDNGYDLKLVLPGSDKGALGAINTKACSMGISASVITPGFVPREHLAALYRNCLALVYPSFFGPDNLPALEAMSYGTPGIVAAVPGAHEQYGDSVLYFNPLKPEQLADDIQRLIADQALRNDLISKGLKRIKKLTPEAYVTKIEEVLLEQKVALECCSLHMEAGEDVEGLKEKLRSDQEGREVSLLIRNGVEQEPDYHRIAQQETIQTIAELRSKIAIQDAEISHLSNALEETSARLQCILLSRSWRASAPIRWLSDQLIIVHQKGIRTRAKAFAAKLVRNSKQ